MEKKGTSTKSSHCFKKTDFHSLAKNDQLVFINNLMKFQVHISSYISDFQKKNSILIL